jgi:8-oxo-dGTP pyrophosphatase MutT (NUDIX family)
MKEVVVVIPYAGDRVLLQLRDDKAGIDFPGHWGFFGGSMDEGETAAQAAARELLEETGYEPEDLLYLKTDHLWSLDDLTSHAFYCSLEEPIEALDLNEGMDWGLFSLAEVQMHSLRSGRFARDFPVIPHIYVANTINDVFARVASISAN